jgi:hypothetical protein
MDPHAAHRAASARVHSLIADAAPYMQGDTRELVEEMVEAREAPIAVGIVKDILIEHEGQIPMALIDELVELARDWDVAVSESELATLRMRHG